MITPITTKLLAALTIALTSVNPAMASQVQALPNANSDSVQQYQIDGSSAPVVTAWNVSRPTAVLVAVHGFGLHKGAFEQFARAMQKHRVSTYSLDVRGFGGWTSNDKGINFEATSDDLTALLSLIQEEHPGKPIFLIGESMGGAIVLDYSARHPGTVDGVISAAPASDRFARLRTAVEVAASYLLKGGRSVKLNHVLVDRVFSNKQLQREWEADPDSKLTFKPAELLKLTHFMKHAEQSAKQIEKLPVLMVQGSNDRLIKPQGTERIFQELATEDKQLIELGEGEHLTFEDGQFDAAVVSQVAHWVRSHSSSVILTASAR